MKKKSWRQIYMLTHVDRRSTQKALVIYGLLTMLTMLTFSLRYIYIFKCIKYNKKEVLYFFFL